MNGNLSWTILFHRDELFVFLSPPPAHRPVSDRPPRKPGVMPAGMFSIDSILSGRPSCKEPLLLHRSGPVVLSAGLADSIYTDYNGLYSATCAPPGLQSVSGTRMGYSGYYYGQLQMPGAGAGPPCCGSVPGLSPQQCPCIPTGRTDHNSRSLGRLVHQPTVSDLGVDTVFFIFIL